MLYFFMALNIKPFYPRAQIIIIPTPKASDTMEANTKTDSSGAQGFCELRLRSSGPAPKDEKERAKKRLWVWGIY